jgi:zinc transporter ZupT
MFPVVLEYFAQVFLAFFVLLRTFLQFHAGIAGMTCDVSSSLGKFRAGIAPIVMLPVLALFTQAVLDLLCCQSWPFLALIAGIVMLPSIWQFLAGIALVLMLAVLSISRRYRSNCAEHEHI